MTRVLVLSVAAGGGHKAAMFSIERSLHEYSPKLEVDCFESKVESLDIVHRNSYTNESLYNIMYRLCDRSKFMQDLTYVFLAPIVNAVVAELRPILLTGNYDAIISTHFLQTFVVLKLRAELGLPVKILTYIPDFDDTTAHFAVYKGIRPDGAIAQSPRYLAKLHKRIGVPRDSLHRAGYLTRLEFTAVRDISKEEARKRVAEFPIVGVSSLDENKMVFLATGGTFWVSEIFNEIQELGKSADFRWDNAQILVACGQNEKAYREYTRLQEELVAINSLVSIIPLPFLNSEQVATVYRASDAVMLSSIAPATLYELLESGAGQPIIRRVNPGPERFNLEYILENNLALFTPTKAEFLQQMIAFSCSSPTQIQEYITKHHIVAEKERAEAQHRAKSMANFIEKFSLNNQQNQYINAMSL